MSNQAVTWAFAQQELPCKAKFVLVALANHADHTNGYCWLKIETISDEVNIPERSLYRYIGALVRNGYLRRDRRRGADGKQRANDYWLLFDRPESKWDWGAPATGGEDPESQDVVEPTADGGSRSEEACTDANMLEVAVGPTAIGGTVESLEEPPKTNLKSREPSRFTAPPRRYKPPPVEPDIQGSTQTGTSERVFVYVGTRAWEAQLDHKQRTTGVRSCPTTRRFIAGVGWREGWDFPTLFPPGGETEKRTSEEGSGVDPPAKKTA